MLEAMAQFLNDGGIATFDKTSNTNNQIYIGQVDLSKEQCIGIYNDITVNDIRNVGVSESYEEFGITFLIRWTSNYETAYEKAKDIQDLLKATDRFTQDGYIFWNFYNTSGNPIFVGTRDDVCEFVLNYTMKINI